MPPTKRIGLVSCVKRKLAVPAHAEQLYTSTLFKKSREWAITNCDEWYVLSAKYGLVRPSKRVEPYEKTMKEMSTSARLQWAGRVYRMMGRAGLLREGVIFIWLAGRDYKKELSELLKKYQQEDPMEHRRMGERLRWLNLALSVNQK